MLGKNKLFHRISVVKPKHYNFSSGNLQKPLGSGVPKNNKVKKIIRPNFLEKQSFFTKAFIGSGLLTTAIGPVIYHYYTHGVLNLGISNLNLEFQ